MLPGAGSVLAAVACAGGVKPTIAGKPYPPTVGLVRERIGEVAMVVGDRASTDGLLRTEARARASGSCSRASRPLTTATLDPQPDLEAPDLLALVRAALA